MSDYMKDLKKHRKLEVLRILREGDINTMRVDGDWNLESFLIHFDTYHYLTTQALEELIAENAIYVDGLGLFRRVS